MFLFTLVFNYLKSFDRIIHFIIIFKFMLEKYNFVKWIWKSKEGHLPSPTFPRWCLCKTLVFWFWLIFFKCRNYPCRTSFLSAHNQIWWLNINWNSGRKRSTEICFHDHVTYTFIYIGVFVNSYSYAYSYFHILSICTIFSFACV